MQIFRPQFSAYMRSSYSRDPSPTCTGADGVHGFAGEPDGGAGAGGRAGALYSLVRARVKARRR
jgi:hypothetical protein